MSEQVPDPVAALRSARWAFIVGLLLTIGSLPLPTEDNCTG